MKFHQKALEFATVANKQELLASVYNQIGVVYRRIDDNPMALEMHVKALALAEEAGDSLTISSAINSIGNVNYNLGRYLFTSLDYNYQINSKVGQSICFNSLGGAYIALDRPHKALEYLQKALHLNEELGDLMQVAISHSKIGETYLGMGELQEAEKHLRESLEIAKGIGVLYQIEDLKPQLFTETVLSIQKTSIIWPPRRLFLSRSGNGRKLIN
jgi:tetratricopeptide (TPR) repeat protein